MAYSLNPKDLREELKTYKQPVYVASTQPAQQSVAPASTSQYRQVKRADGGTDFYNGNQKTTIEEFSKGTGNQVNAVRGNLAAGGSKFDQDILTKQYFETKDPEVTKFNTLNVDQQRERLAQLQGAAGRKDFNVAEDARNQRWASEQLANVEKFGTKKEGNLLTFGQDFVGGFVKPAQNLVAPIIDTAQLQQRDKQLRELYAKGGISKQDYNSAAQNLLQNNIERKVITDASGAPVLDASGFVQTERTTPLDFLGQVGRTGADAALTYSPVGAGYKQAIGLPLKEAAPQILKGVAKEGTAYTVANLANDALQGREITPGSLLVNAATGYGGAAFGAGAAIAKPGVQNVARTAMDVIPTPEKLTMAHPEIQALTDKGTELFNRRQALVDQGLSVNSAPYKQLDNAIKALGDEYNTTYQRVLNQSKNELQRGSIQVPGGKAPTSIEDILNDPLFEAKPPANDFQDILPSKTRPQSVKTVVDSGGNPLYHDTNADSVIGILDSGEIRPSQAPFSQIAGQGKRVSTTRNFDNYSRYGKAPYRFVIDEGKTGQRSIPDNREEFESIFKKPVKTNSIAALTIDTTNPAILDDIKSGKLASVIAKAKEKGIRVETFEGKILPDVQANKEIQALTKSEVEKALQLAPQVTKTKVELGKETPNLELRKAIAERVRKNGGQVDDNGMVTLYHATTPDIVSKIDSEGVLKPSSGFTGGMTGVKLDKSSFLGLDKKVTKDTWGNGRDVIEMKVPAEYIRQPAQNMNEVYIEGGLTRQPDGTWLPNKQPQSTFYDKLALRDSKKSVPQVTKTPKQPATQKSAFEADLEAAGLTPTKKITPRSQTSPNAESDLAFVETVKNSTKTSKELSESLTSRQGDVLTNEQSLADAVGRINKRGFEKSVENAKTSNKGTTETQAESLALITELQKQGRHGDAVEIVEATARRAREIGQASQVLAAYNRLTPEGIVLSAQRSIKNAIKENPKKYGNVKLSEEQAQKLYTLAKEAQATAPDPKLSQAVTDAKKAIDGKTGTAKREAKRKYEAAQEALDIAEDAQIMAQKKVQDELLRVVPASNAKKAILIWKAGLLTGIKGAFGGAIIGNATNVLLRTLRDVPATAIDIALSKFTGNRSKAFNLKGIVSGLVEGGDTAIREFKTGANADDLANKFDYEKIVFSEKPLGRAAQKYTDIVFGVYGAIDKPFKVSATKRSLYEQAIVESKNKSLNRKQRRAYVREFVQNPPTEALETATNEALESTFQQKTALGSALGRFKGAAWQQSDAVGATSEVLAPFTGIPSAVSSAIATFNPLGAPVTIFKAIKKASKGEFDQQAQKELVTALGNQTTGAGILWLGATLVGDNLMTLGYPADPKERKLWEAEGKTPYSINIGGEWKSLNYTGPLMVVLAAGGKFEQERAKGNDIIGSGTAAVLSVPKTVLESSPLSGIDKFLDAINTLETSEGDVSKAAERYIGNTLSSAIPTLVGDISKMGDDKIRETNTILEQIQAKVPGLRNQLQPAFDAFGNELKRRNSAAGTLLDPFKSSKETKLEGAEAEARRLQDAGLGIMPTQAKDAEGSFKGKSRKDLNDINARIGSSVKGEWNKVIQDPRYAILSDENKKSVLDKANDTAYGAIKSEYVDVKLTARQKAYIAGEPVDYFDGIELTEEQKQAAKEEAKAKKTTAKKTTKSSGGRKGARKSYKLNAFGDVSGEVSGNLRKLIEQATIKGV